MFRTAYDEKKRVHSRSGNYLVPDCVLDVKDNGVVYLKECGKINIYKKIQAHRDTCDMALISSKLDPKLLSNAMSSFRVEDVDQNVIADLTAVPLSLGDALNSVKAAENLFNGLPLEVRKEFNFSTAAFVKSAGSEKFMNIFGGKKDVSIPNVPVVSPPLFHSAPGPFEATIAQPIVQAAAPLDAAAPVKKKKKKVIEVEVDDDE